MSVSVGAQNFIPIAVLKPNNTFKVVGSISANNVQHWSNEDQLEYTPWITYMTMQAMRLRLEELELKVGSLEAWIKQLQNNYNGTGSTISPYTYLPYTYTDNTTTVTPTWITSGTTTSTATTANYTNYYPKKTTWTLKA